MTELRKVYKKDIPQLFLEENLWQHDFWVVSRHRLYAHYKNPAIGDDTIVLIIAYIDGEPLGYMGVYTDYITLSGKRERIGWLSTWWVHPKTKGSGIGRDILNAMYEVNDQRIGISQFTPSAKRVYDKSGYFTSLKENVGIKAVLSFNSQDLLPVLYPKLKSLKPIFKLADWALNLPIRAKLYFQKSTLTAALKAVKLEYVNTIDLQTQQLITAQSKNHLSPKTPEFFEWLKAYNWVQESPLIELTQKRKFEFSMYDKKFAFYLVKIIRDYKPIGFLVLQRRGTMLKVLFVYSDLAKNAALIANVVKLHAIELGVVDVVCYETEICEQLKKSSVFIYSKRKVKSSIISKAFGVSDFSDVKMNYGDGDCSFA